MSHSKITKKGYSLYIEKWNPSAKRFINICVICGAQGYSPSIEQEGFVKQPEKLADLEHRAIYAELTKTLKPLALDSLGRCELCAKLLDKQTS